MIKVLNINKQGNKIISYTCTDGSKTLDLTKEQLSQYILQKKVLNATQQVYKGTTIIRVKDVPQQIYNSKALNNKVKKELNKDINKSTYIKIEYLRAKQEEYKKKVEIVINKLSISDSDKLKIMVETFIGFLGTSNIRGLNNINSKIREQKGKLVIQLYNGYEQDVKYEYDLNKSEFIGYKYVSTCDYTGTQIVKITIKECSEHNSIKVYKTSKYDKIEIHSKLLRSCLLNNFVDIDLHYTRTINLNRDENGTLKVSKLNPLLKDKIASNYLQILGSDEDISFFTTLSSMADASESDLYC